MAAIATSADGAYIFLALENASGQPVMVRCSRDNLSAFTIVYNPAAGTAANVAGVPGDADLMIFYGNFGSGVQVISHTISTVTNTNVSPTGLTTKIINTLAVNPSDPNEMWATVNTDQDLLRTLDQGATWETLNATLGFDATALWVHWLGGYEFDTGYIAGHGATEFLLFTPNEGAETDDIAAAALGAATNTVGVEGIEND